MVRTALLAMTLCSTACGNSPPVISADTSCAWTRHIDVTEWQISAMKRDPNMWRPLALEIKGHNDERGKRCT
ncbi:hypothetical protein UFOVP833_38 [uncultured Caudovirales phage]|uniref:Uncharacterized protein n=1 Tax=uncultured Caudovirales phage TaxID=2100421 RepID=A0A6J5P7S0_9CAUD|nr:hypothetical protein UFOVP833_38 [uncultured Caudovirales phage]